MNKQIEKFSWLPWNMLASWMMRSLHLRSLVKTGMLGVAWVFALLFIITRVASIQYSINEEALATSARIKDSISEKLLAPLLTGDYEAVQTIVNLAMQDKNLRYIEVKIPTVLDSGTLLFKPAKSYLNKPAESRKYDIPFFRDIAYPEFSGEITPSIYNAADFSSVDIANIGSIMLVLDFSEKLDSQFIFLITVISFLVLVILFVLALSLKLQKEVSEPLYNMLGAMKEIERSDFTKVIDLPSSKQHEISELLSYSKGFNDLIVQRSHELKQLLQKQETIIDERTKDLKVALIKANQSAESKSNFISIMSHELNQPLFASKMTLTNMGRHPDVVNNHALKNYVYSVQNHLDNAKSQIEHVLEFTRNGKQAYIPKKLSFDVYKQIEALVSSHSSSAYVKGLNIDLVIEEHLPNMIISCPAGLQHIINNLVGNAIKYTDVGGVTVFIRAANFKSASEFDLEVTVSDTGIGIPENDQERIFEYYTQVGDATTRLQGGYGIGLAIVENYVNALNGNRRLKSSSEGSTFIISLPVQRAAQPIGDVQSICIPLVDAMNAVFILYDQRQTWVDGMRSRLLNVNAQCLVANDLNELLDFVISAARQDKRSVFVGKNLLDGSLDNYQFSTLCEANPSLIVDMEAVENNDLLTDDASQNGIDILMAKSVGMEMFIQTIHQKLSHIPTEYPSETTALFSDAPGDEKLAGCKVLLVDDNLSNLEFTREFLQSHGADVDIAHGPEVGIEKALVNQYDAICVDIMMPVINGIEVSHRIRQDSVNSKKPIFAFTAAHLDKEKMDQLQLNNVKMIMKMDATEIMVDRLQYAIERFRLES